MENGLIFTKITERPQLIDCASSWFHDKWGIPKEAYAECMEDCINGKTNYDWYICLDGDKIVGGMGVIENDFHQRPDLTPNICAVYTEEEYRCRRIAGTLLEMTVEDMRSKGVSPIYLYTDHTSFYERYGFEYLCDVISDDETETGRMYIHY